MTSTHNVDPAEINKFEDLASRWWDKNGEFKSLHDINPLRLNFINTGSALQAKKVVDVGCGGGILCESMARCGAQVTGIDMGKAPLSVARLHALEEELDIDYQHTTAEALAIENPAAYDIVTCMEMLEHVPDPSSVINACREMVRPGGSVYFSTTGITCRPNFWASIAISTNSASLKPLQIIGVSASVNATTASSSGLLPASKPKPNSRPKRTTSSTTWRCWLTLMGYTQL